MRFFIVGVQFIVWRTGIFFDKYFEETKHEKLLERLPDV